MGAVVLVAIGGFVLLEGLMWALAPRAMRRAYDEMMQQVSDRDLHIAGAAAVFVGTCLFAYGAKLILQ
jgi:uncharacterized protein YjeT (DUF2065 family)